MPQVRAALISTRATASWLTSTAVGRLDWASNARSVLDAAPNWPVTTISEASPCRQVVRIKERAIGDPALRVFPGLRSERLAYVAYRAMALGNQVLERHGDATFVIHDYRGLAHDARMAADRHYMLMCPHDAFHLLSPLAVREDVAHQEDPVDTIRTQDIA